MSRSLKKGPYIDPKLLAKIEALAEKIAEASSLRHKAAAETEALLRLGP